MISGMVLVGSCWITFFFSNSAEVTGYTAGFEANGGEGTDTVILSNTGTLGYEIHLGTHGWVNPIGAQWDGVSGSLRFIEIVVSGDGNDLIYGNQNDIVYAGGGNDWYQSWTGGTDEVHGGDGNDAMWVLHQPHADAQANWVRIVPDGQSCACRSRS